jgi:hypothetical protein
MTTTRTNVVNVRGLTEADYNSHVRDHRDRPVARGFCTLPFALGRFTGLRAITLETRTLVHLGTVNTIAIQFEEGVKSLVWEMVDKKAILEGFEVHISHDDA